jgi:hypothetical protein
MKAWDYVQHCNEFGWRGNWRSCWNDFIHGLGWAWADDHLIFGSPPRG